MWPVAALTPAFNLAFNLSNPVSAWASGAAGVEVWRLCGREGQDSPAAPELQIPDREGAECQMQNVFLYFMFLFISWLRIIIQEACSVFHLSFYFGLRAAGKRDLQMAN